MREDLGDLSSTVKTLNQQLRIATTQEPRRTLRHQLLAPDVHYRTPYYPQFLDYLSGVSVHEKQRIRFDDSTGPAGFWKALSLRPKNLDDKNITNGMDPGDGLVFNNIQISLAQNIVKDYYDAWSEAIVKSYQQEDATSKGFPKVGTITKLAKICLVLNLFGKRELLGCFCKGDYAGFDLPLQPQTLQRLFGDDYDAHRFSTEQYRVVSRTWNDCQYIEIPKEEPLPFRMEKFYGSGSFGEVHRVRDVRTNQEYAQKEQKLENEADVEEHFQNERNTMGKCHHRHVIKYVKAFKRGWKYSFLLEPAAEGNFGDLLTLYREAALSKAEHKMKEAVKLKEAILNAFGCMSVTLCYVHHTMEIVHKDIKPGNILYHKDSNRYNTILADFGLAHDFSNGRHTGTDRGRRFSMKYAAPGRLDNQWAPYQNSNAPSIGEASAISDDSRDSETRTSSEIRTKPPHGRIDDVFSLGCVFFEALSALVNSPIPDINADDFEFSINYASVEQWANDQMKRCSPSLKLLFNVTLGMTRLSKDARADIDEVTYSLKQSSFAKEYFCVECTEEIRQNSNRGCPSSPAQQNTGRAGTEAIQSAGEGTSRQARYGHNLTPSSSSRLG